MNQLKQLKVEQPYKYLVWREVCLLTYFFVFSFDFLIQGDLGGHLPIPLEPPTLSLLVFRFP